MDQRRYYGLDALRGVMMMLGIVLHSAALHMTAPVLEISIDPATSPIFLIVVLFIHNFRMPLFFVLAGFFASLLVKKYELRGALVNRAKRVLGPLLLGMITILPLMGVFAISYGASVRFGEWQFLATWEQLLTLESEIAEQLQILGTKTGLDVPEGNELSPGHLWFLYYLLYFYLAIPVCRAAVNWANQTRYRSRISSGLRSPLLLPALGLLTALTVLPYPAAQVFGGFLFFQKPSRMVRPTRLDSCPRGTSCQQHGLALQRLFNAAALSRRQSEWPQYLDADFLFLGSFPALFRFRLTLDCLYLPILLLGLPPARTRFPDGGLAVVAAPSECLPEIRPGGSRHISDLLRDVSLPGPNIMDWFAPAWSAIRYGLALDEKTKPGAAVGSPTKKEPDRISDPAFRIDRYSNGSRTCFQGFLGPVISPYPLKHNGRDAVPRGVIHAKSCHI
jgi:hypothetical protein